MDPTDRTADATQHGAPQIARARTYPSPRVVGAVLAALLVATVLGLLAIGPSASLGLGGVLRGGLAALGLGDELPGHLQTIAELRLTKVLVAVGVGAALALSGALLQGIFRNGLAAPSVIGVTAGASLGASLVIIGLATGGGFFLADRGAGIAPHLVTVGAFLGAALATLVVTLLATTGGRISVPTLLLAGIAVNAIAGGGIAALQRFALEESDLMRALVSWSFGRLEDRSPHHVLTIWVGLAFACAIIPRVAIELDLFATGEEDAAGVGVDTGRVKWLALVAAALCASLAVAVAGQIAFVGLITPHLLRRITGPSHRSLLWLCLLGGPLLLCGTDLLQRLVLGDAALPPGVVTSLLGGPFFLYLLLRNRASVEAW